MRLSKSFVAASIVTASAFQMGQLDPKRFRLNTATCDGPTKPVSNVPETSRFLDFQKAKLIKEAYGTPVYVYDENTLVNQARKALSFPNHYGLKVRYAMKASPNAAILKLFSSMGVCFDASSEYEVWRAIKAGIKPSDISLSSQELPRDLKSLIEAGIDFNACSLHQLEEFGKLFPGGSCGVRFNPGKGSGGTGKTVSVFHLFYYLSK
jgi:diaminopimelate decarboxylase